MDEASIIAQVVAFAKTKEGQERISRPFFPAPAGAKLPNYQVPEALVNFSGSYKSLAEGFERTEAEVRDWLKSNFFQPYFNTYLDECLTPARKKAAAKNGGHIPSLHFKAAVARLQHGENRGRAEYSTDFPIKQGWTEMDHLAFFLFRCHRENRNNRNGFLYGKPWTLTQQYHAIWQAKNFQTNVTNSSKTDRRAKAGEKRKRDGKEE